MLIWLIRDSAWLRSSRPQILDHSTFPQNQSLNNNRRPHQNAKTKCWSVPKRKQQGFILQHFDKRELESWRHHCCVTKPVMSGLFVSFVWEGSTVSCPSQFLKEKSIKGSSGDWIFLNWPMKTKSLMLFYFIFIFFFYFRGNPPSNTSPVVVPRLLSAKLAYSRCSWSLLCFRENKDRQWRTQLLTHDKVF